MATSTDTPTKKRGGFASKFALLLTVLLVAALAILVVQNTVHSRVNFIAWNYDLPQGVWLLGAAGVGVLLTLAATAAFKVRRAVR